MRNCVVVCVAELSVELMGIECVVFFPIANEKANKIELKILKACNRIWKIITLLLASNK